MKLDTFFVGRPSLLFVGAIIILSSFYACQHEITTPFETAAVVPPRGTYSHVIPAYDIILVMGQSNTLAGNGYDATLDITNSRVMQLGRFGVNDHKVMLAAEPLQNFTPLDNCIGFALGFARLYAERRLHYDGQVLIIPCGANGSGFIHNGGWNQQDSFYRDAVERTNFVLKKYPGSKLKCILWHQGEADYNLGASAYQGAFERMKSALSKDIKTSNVDSIPFILGGLVPYWIKTFYNKNVIGIDSVLRNEQYRYRFTGFADPQVPFVIKKPDNSVNSIHFDANGQREMSKRYFNEYERLVK